MRFLCCLFVALTAVAFLFQPIGATFADSGESTRVVDEKQHTLTGKGGYPYRDKSDYVLKELDLKPGDVLDLAHGGTEHLHTEKRLITVFFENEPREIPRGTYTTEELKQLFGVQDGYVLEVINEEGQLTPLKPGAKLRVKQGMKFFEQVPCGGSS